VVEVNNIPDERMVPMAKRFLIKPRLFLIIFACLALACLLIHAELEGDRKIYQEQLDANIAQRDQLKQQVMDMQAELEYLKTEQGIEQYARAAGMVMPGEIQFVAGSAQ